MQAIGHYLSPLGGMTLSGENGALTGLWFDGQKYFGATLPPSFEKKELPVFGETRRWLDIYFSGREPDFTPPLAPAGSPFRQRVWALLLRIPYGSCTTYGSLAKTLAEATGSPVSAQAVGGAVGHNPVSVIIPCHRVVGADGSLTGYAGGTDKKLRLLAAEGADLSRLYLPAEKGKKEIRQKEHNK